jgi:hypothetical protein
MRAKFFFFISQIWKLLIDVFDKFVAILFINEISLFFLQFISFCLLLLPFNAFCPSFDIFLCRFFLSRHLTYPKNKRNKTKTSCRFFRKKDFLMQICGTHKFPFCCASSYSISASTSFNYLRMCFYFLIFLKHFWGLMKEGKKNFIFESIVSCCERTLVCCSSKFG